MAGHDGNGLMKIQLLGVAFLILGCLHLLDKPSSYEGRLVQSLQKVFNRKPWLPMFQELWFLGRTSFSVIALIALASINWQRAASAAVVFLITVGLEQVIKAIIKRRRPFSIKAEIEMLQPIMPVDPSFPSGDALRVWYLAMILPSAAGGSVLFYLVAIFLASIVTLGRSVMGVHYPTDMIAGTGLGLIAGGTTMWLWQLFGSL
jgi:undecaprenyl-diphosphatase